MNTPENTFRFCGFDCIALLDQYRDGGAPAIELVAADTENNRDKDCSPGESIVMASINIVDHADKLLPGETFLKTYSGNEGILEILIQAGLVERTQKTVCFGFGCTAPAVKVLKDRFPQIPAPQTPPSA